MSASIESSPLDLEIFRLHRAGYTRRCLKRFESVDCCWATCALVKLNTQLQIDCNYTAIHASTHSRWQERAGGNTRYAFVDHYYHPFIVCCLCHRYFNYFKLKFSFFVSIKLRFFNSTPRGAISSSSATRRRWRHIVTLSQPNTTEQRAMKCEEDEKWNYYLRVPVIFRINSANSCLSHSLLLN